MSRKDKSREKWAKLKAPYRLTVMNHETFEEVGSYKLTLLNLYIALCVILFIGAALVLSLVLFTPIKKWIPGYQDMTNNTEFIKIEQKLRNIENEMASYRLYTSKLQQVISGEPGAVSSDNVSPVLEMTPNTPSGDPLRVVEDTMLRQKIETKQKVTVERKEKSNLSRTIDHTYFIPPVSGDISAGFMIDKKHFGVDILAPKNTPVKAILSGFVIASDWTLETGNTLAIQHDNQLVSFYKHNSELLKKTGDRVDAGEAVAIIGNTGTLSDGPHLHFELWYNGHPLDPEKYIHF